MSGQDKDGRLILAGPFVNGGSRAGLVVYRAESSAEAKRHAEGDPMVKIGRFEVELHEWYVARGVLKWDSFRQPPAAYALATATEAGRRTSSPIV